MHLQVKNLNLDIFTHTRSPTLHTNPPPVQTSPPGLYHHPPALVQIHMTVLKRKQSEAVYTYQLTTKQIFMCKVMFFMTDGY